MKRLLKKTEERLKSRAGFSLAELLVVIIIMLLVSVVVATGIPAATNAYDRVSNAGNAQVLMSTAMTVLRNELKSASDIILVDTTSGDTTGDTTDDITDDTTDDTTDDITDDTTSDDAAGAGIQYTNGIGIPTRITKRDTDNYKAEMYVEEYYDPETSTSPNASHALVSSAAGGGNLYVTYDNITIDYNKDTVTFHNLKVQNKGEKVYAVQDSFSIRILTDIKG